MAPGGRALVLFAHGARDARWREPFERLRALVQRERPQLALRLAFLELMAPSLADAVAELADAGCAEITVVPVFLGQGGHVRRDLPALLAQLQRQYPQLALGMAPAAGEDEAVLAAIARYCLAALDGGGEAPAGTV
jgi:sirohydrochlorin cobaltochelatase